MVETVEDAQTELEFVQQETANEPRDFAAIDNNPLYHHLDKLQSRFSYINETQVFGDLVNTSTVANYPFHRWARYREGYSPKLVQELMRRSRLDPTAHYVLDPM